MYNVKELKDGLKDLVGWRQNDNPNGAQLIDMLTSKSGLYFNDEHPMLTIDNLYSIAPDFDTYVYPAFDSQKSDYAVGDVVDDGSGNLYTRILTHNGNQPLNNTTYWLPFDNFTEWLLQRTQSATIQAINDWYGKKSKLSTVRNLLSRQTIFDTGDFGDIQPKGTDVVGQVIKPRDSRSVIMKISDLSLQIDTNQTVEVKVFQMGVKDPLRAESLTYTGNGSVQWFNLSTPIELEGGEMYYICYNEENLSGNAINAVVSRDTKYFDYPVGKYFAVKSFKVDSDFSEMFNDDDIVSNLGTNYGLNYKVSVSCDYTDFILDQKEKFQTIISKRVAMNLLRELAFNANSNVNRSSSNVDSTRILYEIDGDSQSTEGNNRSLKDQYETALMAIQFDQTGIDKVCLPCRKRGVKYSTI